MSLSACNVTFQTPPRLSHRALVLRLVARRVLAPSALNRPSSPQGAGLGAPAGSHLGAHSPAGRGPVNPFLDAALRSRPQTADG